MDQRTGFWSLFANVNKTKGVTKDGQQQDGLVENYDELTLDVSDEELILLETEYRAAWESSEAYTRVNGKGDQNERYWMGKTDKDTVSGSAGIDKTPYSENIVFEAVETFLPLATQKAPDPLVKTANTPEMQKLASNITAAISYIADFNNLKLKAQEATRNWLNRYIGVIKIGWDAAEKEIIYKVINPVNLILDPLGYVEGGCYYGEFLGEKKKDKARNLIAKFPKKKKEIEMVCNGKLGSILQYTEWWTPDYVFFTMGTIVLNKAKHPYWNYESETDTIDDYGNITQKIIPEKNHFKQRKYPYAFLTVFNLQKSPVDEVSLIEQGRVLQDMINERGKQLTKNIRATNAGAVVSGSYFSKEQAAYVSDALREGRTVWVPTGDVNQAYKRDIAPTLPPYVYQSMQDYRERFLDIFGIRGSTPQGIESEDTVRGKILASNQDGSRIGGGITNHIEVMISYIYNYSLQMMYVFYDAKHEAAIIGPKGAMEYITIQSTDFPIDSKIFIDVQPGSLVPKSPLVQRNEAMDLWSAGATDPLSLYEDLKDPNPEERAQRLIIWQTAPQMLLQQQGETGQPPIPGPIGQAPIGMPPGGTGIGSPGPAQTPQPQGDLLNQVPIA